MRAAALVGILLVSSGALAADFEWRGRGDSLEIRNINGRISAQAASGDEIEVTAVKHARRSDPESVRIEVVRGEHGVTICAVYPTPRGADRENRCAPGGGYSMSSDHNDVKVDFEVRVPRRTALSANTVNGPVTATGLGSHVEARSVNGDVRVSTREWAEAATVNGAIDVSMGSANWPDDLELKTINGRIRVELPRSAETEVYFNTLNGEFSTDFDLAVTRRKKNRLAGTIGRGGRSLSFETLNGTVELIRGG